MLKEVSKLPPKERMGTLIPEYPKGLSGISLVLWEASAGQFELSFTVDLHLATALGFHGG
jgi:hypothetical protein